MPRSKKDILDTEAMLQRLTAALMRARDVSDMPPGQPDAHADAESLRRISMTLHRWHELECGDSNEYGSWAIVRGSLVAPGIVKDSPGTFEYADDGVPYMERHHYAHGRGKDSVSYSAIPDREAGARKRLAAILARYPGLTAYVQGDPRGCALYILKPGDVPEGADVSSCYSNGLAVLQ